MATHCETKCNLGVMYYEHSGFLIFKSGIKKQHKIPIRDIVALKICVFPRRLTMSGSIHAEIPDQLRQQAQTFVRQGWASNIEEVINEALRRYLESHQGVLTENFIQENVEW